MTGLKCLHERTRLALTGCVDLVKGSASVDMEKFEDLQLATPGRKDYADIGTDSIDGALIPYICENAQWIAVCLFANADFRACFKDAILIEKALLQVTREEYENFRDDMTLPSEKAAWGKSGTSSVNLAAYDAGIDNTIRGFLSKASARFAGSGMGEVYDELLQSLSADELADTAYALYNLVYLANAMNRNGVFRKYVRLVLESVKKQLSQ